MAPVLALLADILAKFEITSDYWGTVGALKRSMTFMTVTGETTVT